MGEQGWRRLGERVRAERSHHWRSRADFAAAAGLGLKTVEDLELTKRTNFSRETLAAIEATLGWAPGDAERVKKGQRPTRHLDPDLAHLSAIWPSVPTSARKHILDIAERSRVP